MWVRRQVVVQRTAKLTLVEPTANGVAELSPINLQPIAQRIGSRDVVAATRCFDCGYIVRRHFKKLRIKPCFGNLNRCDFRDAGSTCFGVANSFLDWISVRCSSKLDEMKF